MNRPPPKVLRREDFRRTLSSRVRSRLWRISKSLYARLHPTVARDRRILFILGFNTSGSTTLRRCLETHVRVRGFGEVSELTARGEDRFRLRPLPEVASELARSRERALVIEAKLESQNAGKLLEHFPGCGIVWNYRHYRDVSAANVAKFTSQVEQLRRVVARAPADWRSENLTESVRAEVAPLYSEHMPRADAAALMWHVRNSLLFAQGLDSDERVLLFPFERLAAAPDRALRPVWDRFGLAPPRRSLRGMVDPAWVGIAGDLALSPRVERVCEALHERLRAATRPLDPDADRGT